MVDERISAQEAQYLRGVYQKGFTESYSRYFARQYASLSYNIEGQRNYTVSHMIGKLIGEKVAIHLAKKSAYDDRYKNVSKQKYTEYVYKNYEKSFNDLLDKFEKNAIVEFNALSIFGDNASDEIFTPGEGLSASVKVTNLGEKSDSINLRLMNTDDIRGNGKVFSFFPDALKESFYETQVMANIGSGVLARESVDVGFYLTGPLNFDAISTVLATSKRKTLGINEEAEINKVTTNINLLSGDLSINIEVLNPSAKQTSALPKVVVSVANYDRNVDKEMMHIPGKSTRNIVIGLDNLDPMDIISRGQKITGTVHTEMNGRMLHKVPFQASIGGTQLSNYVSYFHALANGFTTNSGRDTLDERLSKLMNIMESNVTTALASRTNWKKQSEVEATVIGNLQSIYLKAKRDNNLSGLAQEKYDALAKSLAKNVNNKGKGRKVRGKTKYLEALKVFSPTLSTKARSFK